MHSGREAQGLTQFGNDISLERTSWQPGSAVHTGRTSEPHGFRRWQPFPVSVIFCDSSAKCQFWLMHLKGRCFSFSLAYQKLFRNMTVPRAPAPPRSRSLASRAQSGHGVWGGVRTPGRLWDHTPLTLCLPTHPWPRGEHPLCHLWAWGEGACVWVVWLKKGWLTLGCVCVCVLWRRI